MKDDYHLPVVTRPEREARDPGIKKTILSMVQGLNEHLYNQIIDIWKVHGDRMAAWRCTSDLNPPFLLI
ncbi:hypothetical protein EWK04_24510 [Salmonella enterica subsp. enterica serovar Java]|uniref:Uncharacterized protein n=4 Tax=Salmonella enterica TaxID=28901 RepID=A0A3Y9C0A6_SALEB|nr:hypothetical protein [Salmonella enterica subsp. enterica serovar Java]EAO1479866.1 hypothetical protein [Salmonella enterica]ECA3795494.1 hypothetical protein [Salmonella enterica subsp. enterica serovar Aqua]HCM8928442.1 hypothetical protein [Salmonella enterica subsp. enterica serovar Paratyphi B]EAB8477403.1 hypothetical protein [Salmonella enterica subsp. enterica serovar Java]